MTDIELAEEIERYVLKEDDGDGYWVIRKEDAPQIIAALRRGPAPDRGPQVARYSHGNLYHEPADIAKPVERPPSGEAENWRAIPRVWREAMENLLGQIEQGATYHEIAINSPSAQEVIKHAKFLLSAAEAEGRKS